jgi:hypothetical protein
MLNNSVAHDKVKMGVGKIQGVRQVRHTYPPANIRVPGCGFRDVFWDSVYTVDV